MMSSHFCTCLVQIIVQIIVSLKDVNYSVYCLSNKFNLSPIYITTESRHRVRWHSGMKERKKREGGGVGYKLFIQTILIVTS